MRHSKVVGGSTAKRVIACPGSVALCAAMPERPSSSYADEGTLLHDVIAQVLEKDVDIETLIGTKYADVTLTVELVEDKLVPALKLLDEVDPEGAMEYAVESRVGFGDFLPDVFGSCDVLGRIGNRAVVLDWKFGSGVMVEVEENAQLMFYAAAAMRTEAVKWVFAGADEIEMVIVQPPYLKRWVTTPARVKEFETQLALAVKVAQAPDAPLSAGDHCRWCAAKPVCPVMTGAVDRAIKAKIEVLPVEQIAHYLDQAPLIEQFLADLRILAQGLLEEGAAVPGYKLVNKRATRKWVDDAAAAKFAVDNGVVAYDMKIKSPAMVEKDLKKAKIALPADLVVAVSTGSTLVADSDPRPAVLQIGKQLNAALSKLQ